MLKRIMEKRRAPESGFTLIELLVVIIILGILAAVVVFAVGGVGDKGQSSACVIDTRTLRTAQEAYWAENDTYALDEAALVTGGFLSELSVYHEITDVVPATPGNPGSFVIEVQKAPACGTLGADVDASPTDGNI